MHCLVFLTCTKKGVGGPNGVELVLERRLQWPHWYSRGEASYGSMARRAIHFLAGAAHVVAVLAVRAHGVLQPRDSAGPQALVGRCDGSGVGHPAQQGRQRRQGSGEHLGQHYRQQPEDGSGAAATGPGAHVCGGRRRGRPRYGGDQLFLFF